MGFKLYVRVLASVRPHDTATFVKLSTKFRQKTGLVFRHEFATSEHETAGATCFGFEFLTGRAGRPGSALAPLGAAPCSVLGA